MDPAALRLPADGQDTMFWANPPVLRAAVPGTSCALRHLPCTWLATNSWVCRHRSRYCPAAAQLPASAHDTYSIAAFPPVFSAAVAGTGVAAPRLPFCSVTANAWSWPELAR